jgi:hypothetical protein
MSFSLDASDFLRVLDDLDRKQLPYATMLAVNATAQDVLKRVQDRMTVVFDRPTRFTKNAFQVMPRATKSRPEATVGERPSVGKRHYLKVQEAGGPRRQTALEGLLESKIAYGGVLRSIIPAEYAKRDSFGNWSPGERNQVLSALGAQRDRAANATKASKKRARKRASYFVPKHGLAPGVYKRQNPDDIPLRVLTFSDKVPNYQKRLGFFDSASLVFDARIGVNFAAALLRAVA